MPVREAIRQLDAEGYVTIRPNRGAVVTAREREQVVELFEIRGALEGLALRLAAARVDEEALADLEIELARLRNVAADSARRSDSDRLSTSFPTASVWPSIRNTARGFSWIARLRPSAIACSFAA